VRVPGRAHDSENDTMKHWTVRRRTILGFSAVVVIMIVLSLFAYERLAVIQTQAADLQRDYVPSLYLAGRLHVVSIQTHAAVRQHVLEQDPRKITRVADQTNLLSLNAAIEAEKAGEYGRGFAVVATEVRRLADQTAVATYDIGQIVKEIQSAVTAGVMGMDKFSQEVRRGMQEVQHVSGQLSQIIQQVQALAPRVESVNEGMQAQTTCAEPITEALIQLSGAAQQTVVSLRHPSEAMDAVHQVASGLAGGAPHVTRHAA
jgi:Methyl-accepting chemotaxis protein (MCP) signalling domain